MNKSTNCPFRDRMIIDRYFNAWYKHTIYYHHVRLGGLKDIRQAIRNKIH
ncbi:MAG: hypothetical protein KAU83_11630 [Bacteroidales bacterium]|nr:hypothetical protein [Bacteroidales bacterium]